MKIFLAWAWIILFLVTIIGIIAYNLWTELPNMYEKMDMEFFVSIGIAFFVVIITIWACNTIQKL